jgi:hypothetical protein
VIIDAAFLSLRRGSYEKEPVYIAQGTDHEGRREILGFWVMGGSGESSSAWEEIFSEMRERGVERIDIIVSYDLSGIEEASAKVFPSSDHQLCVVHAMRNVSEKMNRRVAPDDRIAGRRAQNQLGIPIDIERGPSTSPWRKSSLGPQCRAALPPPTSASWPKWRGSAGVMGAGVGPRLRPLAMKPARDDLNDSAVRRPLRRKARSSPRMRRLALDISRTPE